LPNRERLVITVGLTLTGLGLTFFIADPATVWLLALVLVGTVCVGTDGIVRSHPKIHLHSLGYTLTFSILPALLTLAAALFLRLIVYAGIHWLIGGLALTGFLLAAVIVGEYTTVDWRSRYYSLARLTLSVACYIAAFTLYIVIYNQKVRSIQSATAVWLISSLLALELFRETEAEAARTWLYAAVVGLVVGEMTWGLNQWPISGPAGGAFLLLAFYVATGMVQNVFAGRLTHRMLFEFGAVAAIGFAFLFFMSHFWVR